MKCFEQKNQCFKQDKLSITDLLIESPNVIRKKLKKMNFREISDLVSILDIETAKMIKYNNKTNDELFDLGAYGSNPKPKEGDWNYNPDFVSNYTSTINHYLKIRKVLEKEAKVKLRL
tara:strand:+ start:205 stop:558 length:354 start_codon:yes stop_codon:yes gene_type:complete